MSTPHAMAQPSPQTQPLQQRPQFSPPPQNQQREFSAANGRTTSFNAASPNMSVTYSSPSPQQFSPHLNHAPPLKRQRLSPDAPSPLSNTAYPQGGPSSAFSPVSGSPTNGTPTATSRPGLMAPPQRPVEKVGHDQSYDDILAGTGIDLEEESRSLSRPDYYGQSSTSFQSANGSFGSYQANSFGQVNGSQGQSFGDGSQSQTAQIEPEDKIKREHDRADWEAARHAQHALWNMFLTGGTINDRIKKFSAEEHLVEAQAGVLVNTQRNAPPPKVRVNGLEGATRVIDQGQSILDTKDKADRLSEIMKLVSLATRARLTGIVSASSRLSAERRAHSRGKVPDEWVDIAVMPKQAQDSAQDAASSAGGTSLKRSHSQMNDDNTDEAPAVAAEALDKIAQSARGAEEARLAKRLKRRAKSGDNKDSDAANEAAEAYAAALDPEKKTTKKERKAAESKFSEQQQHKNANDAARMATSSILGRTFGKKGKSYSWMTGGGGAGGSAASTPGKATGSSVGTPAVTGSSVDRGPAMPRGRRFREFDEEEDKGTHARDVLLVLETDGQTARSFVKGHSMIDGREV